MTALPVAFYLKELSGETSRRRGGAMLGAGEASDLDFQIKEAHARGVLEGRAAAQAENDAAAAQQAAAFEQRLASERQRWASEQGERLGTLIGAALEDIERRVSDIVSETLKPVLHEEVRAKAVAELARTLNGMLSKGAYAKITISGPADLLDGVKTRLAGDHGGVSFVVAEGVDISVNADETILATQIGAWAEAIGGSDP
jgi:hypothetical protein